MNELVAMQTKEGAAERSRGDDCNHRLLYT